MNEETGEPGQSLIGPASYPRWSRTTRILCAVVLPIVFIVQLITRLARHDNIWASIFPPIGITLTVGMWILVVVTAFFAYIDRRR